MYKVDLHTHSTYSPDGSIKTADYARALQQGVLDYIAVTDHNTIDNAVLIQQELGDRIIVGEEISTQEGEAIGLYLKETIPAGLSVSAAVERIRSQNGIVYIPHPFESVRQGLSSTALDSIAGSVDVIEIHNGRALFQNRGSQAREWAEHNGSGQAASSDAHGRIGWGKTYSVISAPPSREALTDLLKHAQYHEGMVGYRGVLYPKYNRLRKRIDRA